MRSLFHLLLAIMKTIIAVVVVASTVAGCASRPAEAPVNSSSPHTEPPAAPAQVIRNMSSNALTQTGYKRDVAQHIASLNASKTYAGRPQALLRSVVVVRYVVDANGRLVRSEILRSNRDRATEATALQSLRSAVPLPRPSRHLLRNGQIEDMETWLFNNDGRFQLRTIAEPQMDR